MAPKSYRKLNLQIPTGLYEQAELYRAHHGGLSQAAFVRLAMHEFLDRHANDTKSDLEAILALLSDNTSAAEKGSIVKRLVAELVKKA